MDGADNTRTEHNPGPKRIGNYEIVRELGRGGMGVVYEARDVALGRTVALKTLLSFAEASSVDLERFQREARLAASLRHPGIVSVHEVGMHEKAPFFTMDFVDGLTLNEYLEKIKPPLPDRVQILFKVAEALAFAHAKNIVHRDIKPGNILVDAEECPHLTDFGLAKEIEKSDRLTATGVAIGTPAYMSPEQALGRSREIGKPSDVYSLGAVMYEALTGQPPFSGSSMGEIVTAILQFDPLPPRMLVKGLSRDLETICLKCLEKSPQRRYPNGKALALDLERYLEGHVIRARPVGLLYKSYKWLLRNKLLSLSAALIVAAASVLIYALFLAPGTLTIVVRAKIAGESKIVRPEVKIDERKISGKGPYSIAGGYHRIALSLKDYQSTDFLVKVAPGEDIKLEKELVHDQGYVTLSSPLSEIEMILVNKATKEKTKLLAPLYRYAIDTGDYEVQLQKRNYFAQKRAVTVAVAEETSLAVHLEPMLLWRKDVSVKPDVTALAAADLSGDGDLEVVCASTSGTVACYDLCTREQLWKVRRTLAPTNPLLSLHDVNRDGVPDILAAHERFTIFDGKTRRELFSLPNWWGNCFHLKDVNGDGYEDLILLSNYTGVRCFDIGSSRLLWATPRLAHGNVAHNALFLEESGDKVMIYAEQDMWRDMQQNVWRTNLYRVDLRNGHKAKLAEIDGKCPCHIRLLESSPSSGKVSRGTLVWYTNQTGFCAMDLLTRELRWQWQGPGRGTGTIVVSDLDKDGKNEVLLYANDLYCLDVEAKKLLWKFDLGYESGIECPSIADLDGDSIPEIVVSAQKAIYILNRGGELLDEFVVDSNIGGHLIVDGDGDGRPDILFCSGEFVYCVQPILDQKVRSVGEGTARANPYNAPVLADFNGDLREEILVADEAGNVYALDSDTGNTLWHCDLATSISGALVVADIDGDKAPDLVASTTLSLQAWTWGKQKLWSRELEWTKTAMPADIDRDGDVEVLTIDTRGILYCLEGKTGEPVWENEVTRSFMAPEVADVNGDGHLEILVMCGAHFGNYSPVFCVDGKTGKNLWVSQVPNHSEGMVGVLVGDGDGDGHPEVFAKQAGGYLSCLDGKSGTVRWTSCLRGGDLRNIALLQDFDGDGAVELVTGNGDGEVLCINARTGEEKWRQSTGEDKSAGNYLYLQSGDFDGDGLLDLISTGYDHSFCVYSGKGGRLLGHLDGFGQIFAHKLVDLDRDGRIDLLFPKRNERLLCIYDLPDYLRRLDNPEIAVVSTKDYSPLEIAFCNKLLRQRAYTRLAEEFRNSEKLRDWGYMVSFYQGICAFSRRETSQAMSFFRRCADALGRVYDNRFLMAACYLEQGENKRAQSLVEELLRESPQEFDRCLCQYRHLLAAKSLDLLGGVIAKAIPASGCDQKLSRAYENALFTGDIEEANRLLPLCLSYASAAKGHEKRYAAYVEEVLLETRQYASLYQRHRSLAILDRALQVIESPELLAERAKVYIQTNISLEQGMSDLMRSLALNPDQPENLLLRAQIFAGMGRVQEALADFEACIELKPENSEAYLGKVFTCLLSGQNQSAQKELDRFKTRFSSKLDQPTSLVYETLLALATGDRARARQEFSGLALVPQYQTTWIGINLQRLVGK